jgi:non-specific serine/threonine protein kinase
MGTSPAALQPLVGYHEQCERHTRRALVEQAFQAANQRGMELALAEAIA